MRSNRKHKIEELEKYIQLHMEEGKNFQELRKDFGLLLNKSAFGHQVLRYQEYDRSGIQSKSQNNHYSKKIQGSCCPRIARRWESWIN